MKLSIIIVTYKVPFFLEQALYSVRKAIENIEAEVIVVDNNSRDNTGSILKNKFPEVNYIVNEINVGFSKANNQGFAVAKGEYILFLNPDTVLREDTLFKILSMIEKDSTIGGIGVKMIDGKGEFLPESKRGFPSPKVAFYKVFGLSRLFPKSKKFNQYHLGHLDPDKNQDVDVLSGAFMMIPKKVLDEIGLWDEDFFMYGEDIDLSFRIKKAGFRNIYFADSTIIHYKGESTKKGSLNYVKTFYEAMIIFAQKHFEGSKAGIFILMLKFAIYLRAFISLMSHLSKKLYLLVLDASLIFLGLNFIKDYWEIIRFNDPTYYDNNPTLIYFSFPLYILFWLFAVFLRGGYDKNARSKHLISGILIGTVAISTIYAFFPLSLRSSRMLILFGMLWTIIITYLNRSLISLFTRNTIFWSKKASNNLIIVGTVLESERVVNLLHRSHVNFNYIGTVSPIQNDDLNTYLGSIYELKNISEAYRISEIIFCGKDLSFEKIIHWMTLLGPEINYKIVPENSLYIIGSNSKNSSGELYAIDISFNIDNSIQRRNKRIMDLIYIPFLILLFPLVKNRIGFFKNLLQVLFGDKTWVGYHPDGNLSDLPKIRNSVLYPTDILESQPSKVETLNRINFFYAKDYASTHDFDIILSAWRKLGQ